MYLSTYIWASWIVPRSRSYTAPWGTRPPAWGTVSCAASPADRWRAPGSNLQTLQQIQITNSFSHSHHYRYPTNTLWALIHETHDKPTSCDLQALYGHKNSTQYHLVIGYPELFLGDNCSPKKIPKMEQQHHDGNENALYHDSLWHRIFTINKVFGFSYARYYQFNA